MVFVITNHPDPGGSMHIHPAVNGAIVIELPAAKEQFVFHPPMPPDRRPIPAGNRYTTRVSVVTVFPPNYFTVAGEQLLAPTGTDPFWELPSLFTDPGLLPSPTREAVAAILRGETPDV